MTKKDILISGCKQEIFLLTPAEHPDHDDLAAATQEIQKVADHINEIKRRKDIVEKIVGDKKKTDISVSLQ